MRAGVMKSGEDSFWYWTSLWWFWTRRTLGILIVTTLGWSFLELIGPGQVIREAFVEEIQSTFPFNLFVKDDPARIKEKALAEARRINLELVQAHCRHITRRNGLWNYFCPLCGKKLLPGDHPWWQV